MLIASLLVSWLELVPGQTPIPDTLDIFKTQPTANVLLLLDASCSMGPMDGTLATNCSWYATTYNGGNYNFTKNQMLESSLVGCVTNGDGLLDRWYSKLNFAVWRFGDTSASEIAAFGTAKTTMETAVLGMSPNGGTPMTVALKNAGARFSAVFTNTNHPVCRSNFIMLMSDGEPNGNNATFNYECTSPVESISVSDSEPWKGARYLYREPGSSAPYTTRDLLCSVTGTQPIRTYSMGFQALTGFNESALQSIATQGDGLYFRATDMESLNRAFEGVLGTIAARTEITFSAPSVQTAGLFAGNYMYVASFKPMIGPWIGTVKKHCIEPPRLSNGNYNTAVTNCAGYSTTGTNLLSNPTPQDLWTYTTANAADTGGAGAVMFTTLGAGANQVPVSPYWTRRKILTWKDSTGYIDVNPTNLSVTDTWAHACDRYRLINFIHGYTYDANCSTGAPLQVRAWPMGAPIGSTPVVLKYGNCHNSSDVPVANTCYLVVAMNDGMLHFFDAANGTEKSALVVKELWQPNLVANNMLAQLNDQPTSYRTHRYYVDGSVRFLHEDLDGDTIIDPTENAKLLFSLGRGGKASYLVNVSRLTNGVLTTANNPTYPLYAKKSTGFEELRDIWHPPYIGRAKIGGSLKTIFAMGSGHVPELDASTVTLGTQPAGLRSEFAPLATVDVACTGTGNFAAYNGLNSSGSNFCNLWYKPGCTGVRTNQCYDTGYWATNPATVSPLNVQLGPVKWASGNRRAGAYRVQFGAFSLGASDRLVLKDGLGRIVIEYTGSAMNNQYSEWIFDYTGTGFYIQLITNGTDTNNVGVQILGIRYAPVPNEAVTESVPAHNPTMFVLDASKWNGSSPQAFTAPASGAVLLRVAKQCLNTDTGTCIDQTTVPALANLKCPISAEVSAYSEGDQVRTLYFGTECGEIWKTWTDNDGTSWSAKRILSLNTPNATGQSKDFRKIFRLLEIVPSACPGTRVTGIYFGTGNEQRPIATDELTNTSLNNGRDVVGVVWDDGVVNDLTVSSLQDLAGMAPTSVNAKTLYSSGKRGWFWRLGQNERMLRDPIVFDGVAYYKTYAPGTGTSECAVSEGRARIYAVNSCDAEPVTDVNGNGIIEETDRVKWTEQTDIGSEMLVLTPRSSPPLVTPGDTNTTASLRLNPSNNRVVPKYYMWRRPNRE